MRHDTGSSPKEMLSEEVLPLTASFNTNVRPFPFVLNHKSLRYPFLNFTEFLAKQRHYLAFLPKTEARMSDFQCKAGSVFCLNVCCNDCNTYKCEVVQQCIIRPHCENNFSFCYCVLEIWMF